MSTDPFDTEHHDHSGERPDLVLRIGLGRQSGDSGTLTVEQITTAFNALLPDVLHVETGEGTDEVADFVIISVEPEAGDDDLV